MWPFKRKQQEEMLRPDPMIGRQKIELPEPDGDGVAGFVETDCNALNKAYCLFNVEPEYLGNFDSFDDAILAIKKKYNKEVAEWNGFAAFGPP